MSNTASSNESTAHPSLKHPGRWLWLLLLVPVIIGLTRLRFDVEVFDLLPRDLPAVAGLRLDQEHFSNARELIITLQAKGPEEAESAARDLAERLRSAKDLVETVTWEPPWLEHPDQASELIGYLWFNQEPKLFNELTNRLASDQLVSVLASTKEELATSMSPQEIGRLSYDPYGLTRLPEGTATAALSFGQGQELFSSPDGSFRIFFVQARKELKTYKDCARWLKAIQRIAQETSAQWQGPNPITLGYTGRPAFVAEIATGMESDMTKSVGGTALIIAILFWLAHRRIKPMLWLLTLLALILGSTLALGGLIFGAINVVSMGFAAILLGLAVDYAVVHYQEALAHPDLTVPQIRHAIAPSIFWAAITTISSFLVLNFGGLPGLAQLGSLVGLGVALAALIMIFEYLPPLFPDRNQSSLSAKSQFIQAKEESRTKAPLLLHRHPALALAVTGAVLICAVLLLRSGFPGIDPTAAALRPRQSAAYAAVDQIQAHLNQKREPLWLIVGGDTATEVQALLEKAQTVLSEENSNGTIVGFNLPAVLWPNSEFQKANRATARYLAAQTQQLREAALTNGFAGQSLVLTEGILNTWQSAGNSQDLFWPTNPMSRWIFEKISAHSATNYYALGILTPKTQTKGGVAESLARIESKLPQRGAWLSGWELLGNAIFGRVKANLWKVVAPMVGLVLLSLFLAFRKLTEILLSVGVLVLSGLCVLSVMRVAGWSWNLLNLMALPLVLGTGVDYSIFMQLALRRHKGDLRLAHASVGRALLLCGGTAIAGFGSLSWSTNAGMASLGQICALGIATNMLIAIFLLPTWWARFRKSSPDALESSTQPNNGASGMGPSSLYRSHFWKSGLVLARIMPRGVAARLALLFADLYWFLAPHRRAIVMQNLVPALEREGGSAPRTTRILFHRFATKVVDLWRFEAGLSIDGLLGNATGWDYFKEAQAKNRGVLLITPHLGNWEFGGPMLTRRGVSLQVLTLAEPGRNFTQLRQASRARWQIETLVVGDNPLAFVEIIKRLEAGATVALLIDRPPSASAVNVELFGRPFAASVAAAELARASGCVLLPVYIPWEKNGYAAHILPAIPYERAALRDRGARQELTQKIMRVFEPIILQYIDQWYHFVPVWAGPNATPSPKAQSGAKEQTNLKGS